MLINEQKTQSAANVDGRRSIKTFCRLSNVLKYSAFLIKQTGNAAIVRGLFSAADQYPITRFGAVVSINGGRMCVRLDDVCVDVNEGGQQIRSVLIY